MNKLFRTKLFIAGISCAIILFFVIHLQYSHEYKQGEEMIQGVYDINKQTGISHGENKPNEVNIENVSNDFNTSSDTDNNSDTNLGSLNGTGCDQTTVFPSKCIYVSPQGLSTQLKSCSDEDMEECNMYTFSLGRINSSGVYILRMYTENGDRLLDILNIYNNRSGYEVIGTYVYEELNLGINKKGVCTSERSAMYYSPDCWEVVDTPVSISQRNRLALIQQNNLSYFEALDKYSSTR